MKGIYLSDSGQELQTSPVISSAKAERQRLDNLHPLIGSDGRLAYEIVRVLHQMMQDKLESLVLTSAVCSLRQQLISRIESSTD